MKNGADANARPRNRKTRIIICAFCKQPRPGRPGQKYCSERCQIGAKRHAEYPCLICATLFRAHGKKPRFTCSRVCAAEWMKSAAVPLRSYIESRIAIDKQSGCHVWVGPRYPNGYGAIRHSQTVRREGKELLAHRVTYEFAKGPIPPGLVVDHLCRNRACVNPDHLEAVTFQENCRRGASFRHGENRGDEDAR